MLYPRNKIFPFLNPSLKAKQNTKQEHLSYRVSLEAQLVKDPPATQETRVQPLGWEDPLEKGTATYSSILASMECIVHGFSKSQTRLSDFPFSVTKVYFTNKPYANKVAETRMMEKGKAVSGHLQLH